MTHQLSHRLLVIQETLTLDNINHMQHQPLELLERKKSIEHTRLIERTKIDMKERTKTKRMIITKVIIERIDLDLNTHTEIIQKNILEKTKETVATNQIENLGNLLKKD